jgi:hypothetical protein
MIGGALARPCISYPSLFSPGTIWERYPYLLPNVFSAVTVLFGVVIGILFLEETHGGMKAKRDPGIELGKRLAAWFSAVTCRQGRQKAEKQPLLADFDELPVYQSTESSPEVLPSVDTESIASLDLECQREAPVVPGEQRIFTRPVVINIVSYGILAL